MSCKITVSTFPAITRERRGQDPGPSGLHASALGPNVPQDAAFGQKVLKSGEDVQY